jgi:2-polyprenyl-3-methyl-5-hydroxy-6-metoxy-1,4-benzoquinol methylase
MTQTLESSLPPSTPRAVSFELDSPELASTYEQVSTRQFNHGKLLIASLAPRPGERVLDVGCGTGRLGDYVAQLVAPCGEVLGVDPLPLRVDSIHATCRPCTSSASTSAAGKLGASLSPQLAG